MMMTVVASSVTTVVTTMTVVASSATPVATAVASPASSVRSPAPLVSKLVAPMSRVASTSAEVLQSPASTLYGQILLNILRSHKTCTCQAGGCLHLPSCSVPWCFCLSQTACDDARVQHCLDICSSWLWATSSAIAFPPHCMRGSNVLVTMQDGCKPCGFLTRLEAAG